jgi:diamine N-acetyltransferase
MPTYRRAEPGDAAQLAALAESTFREAFSDMNTPENMGLHCEKSYNREAQRREILDPSMETIVCEHGGQFVGYLQLRWGPPPEGIEADHAAEIQRLYVAKPWHGTGIARELMAMALDRAEAGGADQVWLGVWEHNPRAIAFYKKFGFTERGEHTFPVGNDPQRDLIMVRPLNAG